MGDAEASLHHTWQEERHAGHRGRAALGARPPVRAVVLFEAGSAEPATGQGVGRELADLRPAARIRQRALVAALQTGHLDSRAVSLVYKRVETN